MGEFLSIKNAGKVYSLFRLEQIPEEYFPKTDEPIIYGKSGYHIRSGKHDITEYDWEQYLSFADRFFND